MRDIRSRIVAGRRRLGALMAALAAAGGLAACGPDFDKGFNAKFDQSTHDSCLPSAERSGAAPAAAEAYCSCVVTELDKLTVQQKMALNGGSPELKTAASACISKVQAGAMPTNAAP